MKSIMKNKNFTDNLRILVIFAFFLSLFLTSCGSSNNRDNSSVVSRNMDAGDGVDGEIEKETQKATEKIRKEAQKANTQIKKEGDKKTKEIKEKTSESKRQIQEKAEKGKMEVDEKTKKGKQEVGDKTEKGKMEVDNKTKKGKQEVQAKTEKGKMEVDEKTKQGKKEVHKKTQKGKKEVDQKTKQGKKDVSEKTKQGKKEVHAKTQKGKKDVANKTEEGKKQVKQTANQQKTVKETSASGEPGATTEITIGAQTTTLTPEIEIDYNDFIKELSNVLISADKNIEKDSKQRITMKIKFNIGDDFNNDAILHYIKVVDKDNISFDCKNSPESKTVSDMDGYLGYYKKKVMKNKEFKLSVHILEDVQKMMDNYGDLKKLVEKAKFSMVPGKTSGSQKDVISYLDKNPKKVANILNDLFVNGSIKIKINNQELEAEIKDVDVSNKNITFNTDYF
ncbi:MAG: hypothetical protein GY830_07470 [Bacteroidetes bacterium]|nr:hypothetical protein [Bacteroidota bacterium]